MRNYSNYVSLSGEAVSKLTFSHESHGIRFYKLFMKTYRLSGTFDIIPVVISEHRISGGTDVMGKFLHVTGSYRSLNMHKAEAGPNKLLLFVSATEAIITDQVSNTNDIFLEGYLCKQPSYRKTPLGREITDLILAVNHAHSGRTDYIPCICWGKDAQYASGCAIGDRCLIHGRIQSREYMKRTTGTGGEIRTAYEVSVLQLEVIEKDIPLDVEESLK